MAALLDTFGVASELIAEDEFLPHPGKISDWLGFSTETESILSEKFNIKDLSKPIANTSGGALLGSATEFGKKSTSKLRKAAPVLALGSGIFNIVKNTKQDKEYHQLEQQILSIQNGLISRR